MTYTLADIFHSSGNPLRLPYIETSYGTLPDWIHAGLITIRLQELTGPHADNFARRVALAENQNPPDMREWHLTEAPIGGGRQHKVLGAFAAAFLQDAGKVPDYEQWADGKRADVISTDREWLIECGDTDAAPVLEHLARTCLHFAVLPFQEMPAAPETDPPLIMFVFERGPQWNDQAVGAMLSRCANAAWLYGDALNAGR